LTSELTRGFDGAHDRREIVVRPEIIAMDYSCISEVAARQSDGAFARRLHDEVISLYFIQLAGHSELPRSEIWFHR
jgi:hypothetical protein